MFYLTCYARIYIENFNFKVLEKKCHSVCSDARTHPITDDDTRMTISQFVGKGMKSAWINKDLIRIDVLEQLKILIIHLAINKP